MSTKQFHIGDILSITDGRLLSPNHVGGVYEILNFMTHDSLFTHQLGRAAGQCKPYLLAQFPVFDSPEMKDDLNDLTRLLETDPGKDDPVSLWLSMMALKYGEMFDVAAFPEGETQYVDPVQELQTMVGDEKIIVITHDPAP